MCEYFCVGFIDYMLSGRTLIGCTSLFLLHDFNKNDKIILKYIKMGEAPNTYPNLIDKA